jgi:DNA mismatch repair protein MutL
MSDIIKILPDHIANQIAAGEVVQRPASVVKELLENSIDAGATIIKLMIKDAGKQLIQVVDNGSGMSETDARRAFERHATSKISSAADLFRLTTMGFRGEALASIAAVAQVELRTRPHNSTLGTSLKVENSVVVSQQPDQTAAGTNFSVSNLFYNTPARRQFLKSDAVELRHILDEFERVALAHSDIEFVFFNNDTEVYRLPAGNLRKRIVSVFGASYQDKLAPVEQDIEALRISGFVGRPELAKKTRGDQYFFVNKRFIKSPYLHHAVVASFEGILAKDQHPFYVIFIEIDPGQIDVNVHPTKTEIKFQEERQLYNILRATVRGGLSSAQILPSFDFETPAEGFSQNMTRPARPAQTGSASKINPQLAGGEDTEYRRPVADDQTRLSNNLNNWEAFLSGNEMVEPLDEVLLPDLMMPPALPDMQLFASKTSDGGTTPHQAPVQILRRYILTHLRDGVVLMDQYLAHLRIIYDRCYEQLAGQPVAIQKLLFPQTFDLNTTDASMLLQFLDQINHLGFEVTHFGGNTFVVHGVPYYLHERNETEMIHEMIAHFKESDNLDTDHFHKLALGVAQTTALRRGTLLKPAEIQEIIDQLFACEMPEYAPNGQRILVELSSDQIAGWFR